MMAIRKVSSKGTEACPTGEVLLAAGAAMAMRMWQGEERKRRLIAAPTKLSAMSSPAEPS